VPSTNILVRLSAYTAGWLVDYLQSMYLPPLPSRNLLWCVDRQHGIEFVLTDNMPAAWYFILGYGFLFGNHKHLAKDLRI
jgi:hypothetical protein